MTARCIYTLYYQGDDYPLLRFVLCSYSLWNRRTVSQRESIIIKKSSSSFELSRIISYWISCTINSLQSSALRQILFSPFLLFLNVLLFCRKIPSQNPSFCYLATATPESSEKENDKHFSDLTLVLVQRWAKRKRNSKKRIRPGIDQLLSNYLAGAPQPGLHQRYPNTHTPGIHS